jgi:hypothetical protein
MKVYKFYFNLLNFSKIKIKYFLWVISVKTDNFELNSLFLSWKKLLQKKQSQDLKNLKGMCHNFCWLNAHFSIISLSTFSTKIYLKTD